MNIILFGGAFDPIHNGHLSVAREIVEQQIASEVWFVPCATHPFGKQMSSASDRLAMLERAGKITVTTHELDNPTTSFSVDTIEFFAKTQPQHTFSWLIGSDQLPFFTRWHRWQDLVENFTVYVYPRDGSPFDQLQMGMVALTQLPVVAISSSMIRERVLQQQPIDDLVPSAVAQYILEKKLYAS